MKIKTFILIFLAEMLLCLPAITQNRMGNDSTGNMKYKHMMDMDKDHHGMDHHEYKDDMNKNKWMKKGEMHMQENDMLSPMNQMKLYIMAAEMLPEMQDELNLTDAQVNQLIDIQTGYIKQKADLKSDLRKKELRLRMLLQNKSSSKEVSDQLKSCATTMTDIAIASYEAVGKMVSILNADQMQKLQEMKKHHEETMREWDHKE